MDDREFCLSIHFTAKQVKLIQQFQEVPESDKCRLISQLASVALNLKVQDITTKPFLKDRKKACEKITKAIHTILSEKDHLHLFDLQSAIQDDLFLKLEKFRQFLAPLPDKKGRNIDIAERFTLWSLWGIFKRLKLPIKTDAWGFRDRILSQIPKDFLQIAQVVYAAAGREKTQETIARQVKRAGLLKKDPHGKSMPGLDGIASGMAPPLLINFNYQVNYTYYDDGSYTMTVRYSPAPPKTQARDIKG